MFEGVFKSKFYSKCKSAAKLTKTRIEIIKRKRTAMQKYMRNDIGDLLMSGRDVNAYGRADGLLVELNTTACYDFVEKFCECILKHVAEMDTSREYPEECREAVPSLMFAAARFADLPELRELRRLFSEKYRNSLDPYINKQFVEMVKASPPTMDMKIQVLQDLALEFGIQWDSKALVQELYKLPPSVQAGPENTDHDKHTLHKRRDKPVREIDGQDKEDLPPFGRKDISDDRYRLHESGNDPGDNPIRANQAASINQNDQQTTDSNSESNASEGKPEDKQPFYYRFLPPPYIKSKAAETQPSSEVPSDSGSQREGCNPLVVEAKTKPISVRRRPSRATSRDEGDGVGKIRQEAAKPGLKMLCDGSYDQRDEEERMMDDHLMHQTREELHCDGGNIKATLKPLAPQRTSGLCNSMMNKGSSHTRAASLPLQLATSTESASSTELKQGHARTSSFHENLRILDYDDFLARFAALQGKLNPRAVEKEAP